MTAVEATAPGRAALQIVGTVKGGTEIATTIRIAAETDP